MQWFIDYVLPWLPLVAFWVGVWCGSPSTRKEPDLDKLLSSQDRINDSVQTLIKAIKEERDG